MYVTTCCHKILSFYNDRFSSGQNRSACSLNQGEPSLIFTGCHFNLCRPSFSQLYFAQSDVGFKSASLIVVIVEPDVVLVLLLPVEEKGQQPKSRAGLLCMSVGCLCGLLLDTSLCTDCCHHDGGTVLLICV